MLVTPLHSQCIMKYLSVYSVVFVLLQNRSLCYASERGDLEEVKSLVNKKADVNWHNPEYDVSSIL